MNAVVRRAGSASLADGPHVTWSVADGRRGRRWRVVTTRDGTMVSALLLEVGVDGRPSRLELTTAVGLLTLHPEPNGFLHGNAVTRDGVRHLTFPWSGEHEIEIDGLPVTEAVAAQRLSASMAVGEGRTVPVVVVGPDLSVRDGRRRYVRVNGTTWRIEGDSDADTRSVTIDDRGLLKWAGQTESWPLERESHG
jgi:hypothetical protein